MKHPKDRLNSLETPSRAHQKEHRRPRRCALAGSISSEVLIFFTCIFLAICRSFASTQLCSGYEMVVDVRTSLWATARTLTWTGSPERARPADGLPRGHRRFVAGRVQGLRQRVAEPRSPNLPICVARVAVAGVVLLSRTLLLRHLSCCAILNLQDSLSALAYEDVVFVLMCYCSLRVCSSRPSSSVRSSSFVSDIVACQSHLPLRSAGNQRLARHCGAEIPHREDVGSPERSARGEAYAEGWGPSTELFCALERSYATKYEFRAGVFLN